MYACLKVAYNVWQACAVRLMKHCLPKRFFKDMCFLVFCKRKMSIREATLNLQKPCTSARIAPWLAVRGTCATYSFFSESAVRICVLVIFRKVNCLLNLHVPVLFH